MDALGFAVELMRLSGVSYSESLLLKYLRAMHAGEKPIRSNLLLFLPRWRPEAPS
jgi:hypothetical protein